MQAVETRTIQPIPARQRLGRSRDLFTLWFGSILTIVTGAFRTTIFRLPVLTAVTALAGSIIGHDLIHAGARVVGWMACLAILACVGVRTRCSRSGRSVRAR